MTWWGWSVGAVLAAFPLCILIVLRLANPGPAAGDLRAHQARIWRHDGTSWQLLPPPARADHGLRFHPIPEPTRPPRPMNSCL